MVPATSPSHNGGRPDPTDSPDPADLRRRSYGQAIRDRLVVVESRGDELPVHALLMALQAGPPADYTPTPRPWPAPTTATPPAAAGGCRWLLAAVLRLSGRRGGV